MRCAWLPSSSLDHPREGLARDQRKERKERVYACIVCVVYFYLRLQGPSRVNKERKGESYMAWRPTRLLASVKSRRARSPSTRGVRRLQASHSSASARVRSLATTPGGAPRGRLTLEDRVDRRDVVGLDDLEGHVAHLVQLLRVDGGGGKRGQQSERRQEGGRGGGRGEGGEADAPAPP